MQKNACCEQYHDEKHGCCNNGSDSHGFPIKCVVVCFPMESLCYRFYKCYISHCLVDIECSIDNFVLKFCNRRSSKSVATFDNMTMIKSNVVKNEYNDIKSVSYTLQKSIAHFQIHWFAVAYQFIAMKSSPLSFLNMTSGKAAGEKEKIAVLQVFALRGALAYLKANPECGFDSRQAAEIFEGVLITGIKELEKEPIVFDNHEWKLHKRLSDSKGSESKATEVEITPDSKPKSEETSPASMANGKTNLSKELLSSDPNAFLDLAATSNDHREAFHVVIIARSPTLLCQMLERGWKYPEMLEESAKNGWLEGIRLGLEHGCAFDKLSTTIAAVENGHVDCLRYLLDNAWKPSNYWKKRCRSLTIVAARHGHLECLRYLHEFGIPWSKEYTAMSAAEGGHLECLRYAHEHGCPWNDLTTSFAEAGGHLDCLRYALENGCKRQKMNSPLGIN